MSEMVERVARALCKADGNEPGVYKNVGTRPGEFVVLKGKEENWKHYVDKANAAIEAMREPTEEMLVASQVDRHDFDVAAVWAVMIDAALDKSKTAA